MTAFAFSRSDDSDDRLFYAAPRFVTHIADATIDAVTGLYRERIAPGAAVLDLMSSWVSHLPPEVAYGRVVGLGMNAAELERNPRLDASVVHDLNADPRLPFADASFDAVTICVSVQYLTRPVEVSREIARVLRPGGEAIISFSNRCFPTKAVAIWQALDGAGHAALVQRYLARAGGFATVEALDRSPRGGDPLYAVIGTREA